MYILLPHGTRTTCHIPVSLSNHINTIITIQLNLDYTCTKINMYIYFKLSKHNYMVVVRQQLNSL